MITVCCLTYNHEEYIQKTLLGILNQIANFNIEILIFDDASNDLTYNIISDIMNTHENGKIISYYKNEINLGSYLNFQNALKNCKKKYIAFCEGDDYWTDCQKLQKQVDFLEKNNEYNLCYHDVLILNSKGIFSKDFINKTNKNISTKYDLAVWGNYIHTCSVVVRNNKFLEFFNAEVNLCDYISYIQFVNDGKINKIEETMAVYRYGDGIWSNSSNRKKQKFIVDNIFTIKKITNDDTINEIMQLRLNSIALYSLPKYVTKFEDPSHGSFYFEINEKIPISIIFKIIRKKIILKFKYFFKKY
jgi:glycosyltransferase involved in cell wall biosynthesis